MKVNELMIGDWVECVDATHKKKVYAQVGAIEVGQTCILVEKECCNWFLDITFLNPIPLTPEILEKNGFKFQSACICDNKDAWIWEWPSDKEYELPHCFMLMSHHNKKKYPYFWIYAPNNPDIKYVHELQHALRLCGIEKEIIV